MAEIGCKHTVECRCSFFPPPHPRFSLKNSMSPQAWKIVFSLSMCHISDLPIKWIQQEKDFSGTLYDLCDSFTPYSSRCKLCAVWWSLKEKLLDLWVKSCRKNESAVNGISGDAQQEIWHPAQSKGHPRSGRHQWGLLWQRIRKPVVFLPSDFAPFWENTEQSCTLVTRCMLEECKEAFRRV